MELPSVLAIAFGDIITGARIRTEMMDQSYVVLRTENTDRLDAIQEMAENREILFSDIGRKIRLRRPSPEELEFNIADLLDLPAARRIGGK